mmetsp:Transcript_70590/g.161825  ORF Transcript_70590/g.161825 Transcript_70590/m.161825 type:complete len:216 (+) Transcript_70590:920-1567(+)
MAISFSKAAMSVVFHVANRLTATCRPVSLSTPRYTAPDDPCPTIVKSRKSRLGSWSLNSTALLRASLKSAFRGGAGRRPPPAWNSNTSNTTCGFCIVSSFEIPDPLSRASHSSGSPVKPTSESGSTVTCVTCRNPVGREIARSGASVSFLRESSAPIPAPTPPRIPTAGFRAEGTRYSGRSPSSSAADSDAEFGTALRHALGTPVKVLDAVSCET